jgi:hypothetical protein
MKKIPEHIILDYSEKPPKFICVYCGATRELRLPAMIDDVVRQHEAFAGSHKYCKQGQNDLS